MFFDNYYINGYDLIIYALIIVANILIIKFNLISIIIKNKKIGLALVGVAILYGFIFPCVPASRESKMVHETYEVGDGYNLFYLLLRYPIYWAIGFLQIIFFIIVHHYQRKKIK